MFENAKKMTKKSKIIISSISIPSFIIGFYGSGVIRDPMLEALGLTGLFVSIGIVIMCIAKPVGWKGMSILNTK